jgi:hypothetical protein
MGVAGGASGGFNALVRKAVWLDKKAFHDKNGRALLDRAGF